jgi:hypothetical protein
MEGTKLKSFGQNGILSATKAPFTPVPGVTLMGTGAPKQNFVKYKKASSSNLLWVTLSGIFNYVRD